MVEMIDVDFPNVKMLSTEDVIRKVKLPRSTIRYYIKKNRFPVPVQLGPRRIGWPNHEINKWLFDRMKNDRVKYEYGYGKEDYLCYN
jgi:predicted DNA-binding transcriptional regulator AlpA